jgi:hypothetical protein
LVFYKEWQLAPEIQLFSEIPNPELAEGEGALWPRRPQGDRLAANAREKRKEVLIRVHSSNSRPNSFSFGQ